MIRFEQVSKSYPGGFHALKNVSFNIDKGVMIFEAGHSGAGKSTILKLIAGITKPTTGKVWVNNQDIGSLNDNQIGFLRQHIGIVFQDHKILFKTCCCRCASSATTGRRPKSGRAWRLKKWAWPGAKAPTR